MSVQRNFTFPVHLVDAGGGGDCFYYSVWSALNERDLIRKKFYPTIPIPLDKENFMLFLRHYVYKTLESNTSVEGIYDFYNSIGLKQVLPAGQNLITFLHPGDSMPKLIVDKLRPKMKEINDFLRQYEIQEWIADLFLRAKNKEEFKRSVLDVVKRKGTYAQEFEVKIISDLFKKVGIEIEKHYDANASGVAVPIPQELPMINANGNENIHLLILTNFVGGHYRYFSFSPAMQMPMATPMATPMPMQRPASAMPMPMQRPASAMPMPTPKPSSVMPSASVSTGKYFNKSDPEYDSLEYRLMRLKYEGGRKRTRKNKKRQSKKYNKKKKGTKKYKSKK